VSGDGQFKRKGVSFQVNDTSAAFIELFTASDNYGCYRGNGTLSIFDAGTTRALATTTATPRINLAAENAPSWIAGSLGLGQKTAAYTLDVSGTTFSSNALFPGYIRNALTPSQFDISGGNISNSGAIKTTSLITQNFYPTSTADVSAIAYIRVGAADAPSANLPFLWMRGGGNPYRYAGINYGAFNAGSFMTYNAGSSLVTKYIGALPSAQSQLDACASILTLNTAGQVGIGTLSPAYVLDVSAGTTVPSINMSSWPRVPVGNTYIAKGVASYPAGGTSPPMFSNALQSINTELAVVTNDATYGTYFVIKKSGIWSVHMGPFSNSALGGTGILDASNNFTQLALPPYGPRTIDYSAQTGVSMTSALKYTGFLPSNAGVYYKVVQNNTTLSGNSNSSVFTLSFLAETPAGPANYPI
jgi:hypothetical protein